MSRILRWSALLALPLLSAVATVAVTAAPAAADPPGCAMTVSTSTTLTSDIGPCPHGGITVAADGVTLDLGGHRVFGTPQPGDGAGIYLLNRTGVTVRNGAVSAFDGGVVIEGGGSNVVTGLTVEDNVGRSGQSAYGDGIALESTVGNRVVSNTVRRNGGFSGIGIYSLVDSDHPRATSGTSTGNVIEGNFVADNTASRDGIPTDTDNDGIRLENSSVGNFVTDNLVSNSGLDGISLFRGSGRNTITGNTVTHNGFFRTAARRGSGIISFNLANQNRISNNIVTGNADNGIAIRGPLGATPGSTSNQITFNTATANVALSTIPSAAFGPAFDLNDGNPNCDADVWYGNRYGTANPPCTTAGGTHVSAA
ncbi:MAG: right-handed parallel beta-helix repeat-containing protein [Acidimicrobiales bacterium]